MNGSRASPIIYIGVATTTAPDDDDIVKQWNSLMDHLCNKHDDCYHDPLDALEQRRKNGLYQVCTIGINLVPCLMLLILLGSKAIDKLDGVITNGRLLSDMKKLSPSH